MEYLAHSLEPLLFTLLIYIPKLYYTFFMLLWAALLL